MSIELGFSTIGGAIGGIITTLLLKEITQENPLPQDEKLSIFFSSFIAGIGYALVTKNLISYLNFNKKSIKKSYYLFPFLFVVGAPICAAYRLRPDDLTNVPAIGAISLVSSCITAYVVEKIYYCIFSNKHGAD